MVIDVRNLTKVYPIYNNKNDRLREALSLSRTVYHTDFHALKNVGFNIKRGETVGIIGQNGSGKSTLLKILTGVLSPTSGAVEVRGKVSALLELGAGFNPEMTGMENIYLNGTIMGYSREEMDIRVSSIIDFADIGEFINQPVKIYSSGMFIRLAFAVAVNVDPDILIVDEALAVGDMAFQAKCITKMTEIIERGVTVIFVSHDIGSIKSLCDRCIYLSEGSIILDGRSKTVTEAYLSDVRRKMNETFISDSNITKNTKARNIKDIDTLKHSDQSIIKDWEGFKKKVNLFREGNGSARVIYAELLDLENSELLIAEFNQRVKIRIIIEFFEEKQVAIAYHIRDDRNINILGSGTFLENQELVQGRSGDRMIVEFTTNLPLTDGDYNISIVISQPFNSENAIFFDVVKNAILFKVQKPEQKKIWDKVYLKNEITILKIRGH